MGMQGWKVEFEAPGKLIQGIGLFNPRVPSSGFSWRRLREVHLPVFRVFGGTADASGRAGSFHAAMLKHAARCIFNVSALLAPT